MSKGIHLPKSSGIEQAKSIAKKVIKEAKDVKEDLSQVRLPVGEGVKAAKKAYEETGSIGEAAKAGVKETGKTHVNNTKQFLKAATEGSIFDKD